MIIRLLLRLFRNNTLFAALGINALFKPFYKLSWIVAAKNSGILDLLSSGPVPFAQLSSRYCSSVSDGASDGVRRDAKASEALEAWLQLGLRLGLLRLTAEGYSLKG